MYSSPNILLRLFPCHFAAKIVSAKYHVVRSVNKITRIRIAPEYEGKQIN